MEAPPAGAIETPFVRTVGYSAHEEMARVGDVESADGLDRGSRADWRERRESELPLARGV